MVFHLRRLSRAYLFVRTYVPHNAVVPYRRVVKGDFMILVTGASGNAGGAVVNELLKSATPFRGMYRSQQDAAKAPPGVATVVADFSSMESMNRALTGIESVYLVCSPIPELVELESRVIDACQGSGVKHL